MSNYQFFTAVFFGWVCHSFYAAMRRMSREIEREKLQRDRDRYTR